MSIIPISRCSFPFIVVGIFLLTACGSESDRVDAGNLDSIRSDSLFRDSLQRVSLQRDSLRLDSIAKIPPPIHDSSFIPANYQIKDVVYGDLNLDSFPDAIVVMNSMYEAPGSLSDIPRWFYILTGNSDGSYGVAFKSKNVTPAQEAGQMFGEPYNGIEIDSGTFVVRHYGGSRFRWTYDYVFEYNSEKETWFYVKNYATAGDMLGEMGDLDSLGQCIPYDYDTLIVNPKIDIRKFDCSVAPTAEPEF